MRRLTLDRVIEVSGRAYIGFPWHYETVTISPSQSRGLVWCADGCDIVLNSDVLSHFNQRGSENVRKISHQTIRHQVEDAVFEMRVPEHMISALYLKGITDARIEISKPLPLCVTKFIWGSKTWSPPIGDGTGLAYHKKIVAVESEGCVPDWVVSQKKEVCAGYGSIKVEPFSKLDVTVNAWENDPYGLNPERFSCSDVYGEENPDVLGARAVSSHSKLGHGVRKSFEWFVCGINANNYVPRYAPQRMGGQFQDGRNEHFAHLVFSDFPSELCSVFGGRVYAKFTLEKSGGSHSGRIAALTRMRDDGVFVQACS